MAVTPDAGYPVLYTPGSTPDAHALTLASGSDTLLLAFMLFESAGGSVTSMAWNTSEALTQLGTGYAASTWTKIQCYYLKSPTSGSHDLTVTFVSGGFQIRLVVYALSGAHQTTPLRTQNGAGADTGTSSSHAISGFSAGDYAIDVMHIDGTSHNPVKGTDQTYDYALDTAISGQEFRGSDNTTNGTMSWTWTTSGPNTHFAAAVIPSGGAAPQQLRPDADTDADSWTTAPLWSKVDEASAGGDVITATAS